MKADVATYGLTEQRVVIFASESGRRYDLGKAPTRIKWFWPKLWLYKVWHLPLRKRALRRS